MTLICNFYEITQIICGIVMHIGVFICLISAFNDNNKILLSGEILMSVGFVGFCSLKYIEYYRKSKYSNISNVQVL